MIWLWLIVVYMRSAFFPSPFSFSLSLTLFPRHTKDVRIRLDSLQSRYEGMGPMTMEQKIILIDVAITMVLWMTRLLLFGLVWVGLAWFVILTLLYFSGQRFLKVFEGGECGLLWTKRNVALVGVQLIRGSFSFSFSFSFFFFFFFSFPFSF